MSCWQDLVLHRARSGAESWMTGMGEVLPYEVKTGRGSGVGGAKDRKRQDEAFASGDTENESHAHLFLLMK